jgi:hypothetical protein
MNFNFLGNNNKIKKQPPIEIIEPKIRSKLHLKDLWSILHISAIFLPSKNEKEFENAMNNFADGLVEFGSFTDGAKIIKTTYIEYKKNKKLNFSNREKASLSLCHFHNHINLLTEKELFECTMDNISKRWGNFNDVTNNKL